MRASPLVEGRLAGVPARFVLDTGAGTHTLASWLAKKAGLKRQRTELKLRDAAGRSVDLSLVHGVKVAIDGLGAFTLRDAVVAEFPPFFDLNARCWGNGSHRLRDFGGQNLRMVACDAWLRLRS
jgi:hypothetical protein